MNHNFKNFTGKLQEPMQILPDNIPKRQLIRNRNGAFYTVLASLASMFL
jgi:hypothetical protein